MKKYFPLKMNPAMRMSKENNHLRVEESRGVGGYEAGREAAPALGCMGFCFTAKENSTVRESESSLTLPD